MTEFLQGCGAENGEGGEGGAGNEGGDSSAPPATLTKLVTAFSRDQAEKVYVQHRMRENGAEIFGLLERGCYVFVCGDGARMASDTHAALLDILQAHGRMSLEAAERRLQDLSNRQRYTKNIWS